MPLVRRSFGGKCFNNPHEDTEVEEVIDDKAMEAGPVNTFGKVIIIRTINFQVQMEVPQENVLKQPKKKNE